MLARCFGATGTGRLARRNRQSQNGPGGGGPNIIVQLYEVYEEKAFCYYLIMEVMEGGMVSYTTGTHHGKEDDLSGKGSPVGGAVWCVLRALVYCTCTAIEWHTETYIKPENLLLLSDPIRITAKDLNSFGQVGLDDFSFARKIKKRNATPVGHCAERPAT